MNLNKLTTPNPKLRIVAFVAGVALILGGVFGCIAPVIGSIGS